VERCFMSESRDAIFRTVVLFRGKHELLKQIKG